MKNTVVSDKVKAIEMWLKYKETGNVLYKILAEYYDDLTNNWLRKRIKIA